MRCYNQHVLRLGRSSSSFTCDGGCGLHLSSSNSGFSSRLMLRYTCSTCSYVQCKECYAATVARGGQLLVFMYICMYVCVCVCVYVGICMCVCVCVCRCHSRDMCYIYIYIYIYIYVYVYVYVYVCICMYIYIHTHT